VSVLPIILVENKRNGMVHMLFLYTGRQRVNDECPVVWIGGTGSHRKSDRTFGRAILVAKDAFLKGRKKSGGG
jgi:hypothetical protein